MEYKIKNRRRIPGSVFDVEIGTVVFPDGLQIEVTFERNSRELIIHRGYLLGADRCSQLVQELEKYFNDYIDNGAA